MAASPLNQGLISLSTLVPIYGHLAINSDGSWATVSGVFQDSLPLDGVSIFSCALSIALFLAHLIMCFVSLPKCASSVCCCLMTEQHRDATGASGSGTARSLTVQISRRRLLYTFGIHFRQALVACLCQGHTHCL